MKQKSGRAARKAITQAQRERKAAFDAKILRLQLAAGYAVVGITVVAGFLMSFAPHLFGMERCSPAVGVGLALLAGFRLLALRREMRRQDGTPAACAVTAGQ